jgi:hypothetical protein
MAWGVKSLRHTGHRDGSSRMEGMTGKGRKEDELLRQGLGRVKSEEERWEREDWEADDEEEMSAESVDGMAVVVVMVVVIFRWKVTTRSSSREESRTRQFHMCLGKPDGRSNHEPTSNKKCVEITCTRINIYIFMYVNM